MQTQTRFWSRLGALGGVYAVLFVIASILLGEPGSGTAGAAVVQYYRDHQTTETAGVFAVAFALVALTFFLASLRRTLSATDEGRFLANVVTAGGAVYAAGLMVMTALTVALIDAAKNNMPATAQTLNVLSSDMWPPVVVGLALLGLGTGVSALRSAALPKWLGWVSVAFGLLALVGPRRRHRVPGRARVGAGDRDRDHALVASRGRPRRLRRPDAPEPWVTGSH